MSSVFPSVGEIADVLTARFGCPRLGNKSNPFNELLYILLSSKTPPDRYQEVYRTLRLIYKKADSLADADPEDVAEVISQGGLQNRKAQAIVAIARRLRQEFGRVTLAPLARMSDQEAERFLMSLPEVSKKTARCVLMYSLDRAVFPVDSHCFRICKRLGWISGENSLTDRVADFLQEGVPSSLRLPLHIGMVLLGRDICLPTRPRCESCPVIEYCSLGAAHR
ncbi:MAG: hypothetical protein JXA14_19105 [Anaerolineae bacterium]|nr:hypothetical protein [Anaerolineae bacterium]